MERICLCREFHRCSNGHLGTLEALPSGNSISMKLFLVYSNAEVDDVCQSNIHMDGRAKISQESMVQRISCNCQRTFLL